VLRAVEVFPGGLASGRHGTEVIILHESGVGLSPRLGLSCVRVTGGLGRHPGETTIS